MWFSYSEDFVYIEKFTCSGIHIFADCKVLVFSVAAGSLYLVFFSFLVWLFFVLIFLPYLCVLVQLFDSFEKKKDFHKNLEPVIWSKNVI